VGKVSLGLGSNNNLSYVFGIIKKDFLSRTPTAFTFGPPFSGGTVPSTVDETGDRVETNAGKSAR
jgi:hypothetical protein